VVSLPGVTYLELPSCTAAWATLSTLSITISHVSCLAADPSCTADIGCTGRQQLPHLHLCRNSTVAGLKNTSSCPLFCMPATHNCTTWQLGLMHQLPTSIQSNCKLLSSWLTQVGSIHQVHLFQTMIVRDSQDFGGTSWVNYDTGVLKTNSSNWCHSMVKGEWFLALHMLQWSLQGDTTLWAVSHI